MRKIFDHIQSNLVTRASIVGAIILILSFGLLVWSQAGRVDVVEDIPPVSTEMNKFFSLADLANMSPEQRQGWLAGPNGQLLRTKVLDYLERHGEIKSTAIDSFNFYFGSVNDAKAGDANGTTHVGYFNNQLVAAITVKGETSPKLFLIKCLNGLALNPNDLNRLEKTTVTAAISSSYINSSIPEPKFIIVEPRKGFCDNMKPNEAITFAAKNNLSLYKKVIARRNKISAEQAQKLASKGAKIIVAVKPGDKFLITDEVGF